MDVLAICIIQYTYVVLYLYVYSEYKCNTKLIIMII